MLLQAKPKFVDLKLRIQYACAMALVCLAMLSSHTTTILLLSIVELIAILEWHLIVVIILHNELIKLNVSNRGNKLSPVGPLLRAFTVYVPGLMVLMIFYYTCSQLGYQDLLGLLLTVWTVDIAAYFSGNIIGGPLLWPSWSPNKTVAGLLGGVVIGCLAGLVCTNKSLEIIFMTCCAAQLGDLLESKVKRIADIKDSNFDWIKIPGHGGFLDRIDGLLLACPVYYICSNYMFK